MRFDLHCDTYIGAEEYIRNRAIQLLKFNIFLDGVEQIEGAVIGYFRELLNDSKEDKLYMSIYILESYRGKNLYDKYYKEYRLPILTSYECELEEFLISKKYNYKIVKIVDTTEYEIIQNYYGSKRATRSNVYYMNHIDEGLAILQWIGASAETKKAYCLHPIFQMDADLSENKDLQFSNVSQAIIVRAMEYRSVANDYLSYRHINSLNEIRLSPISDVNEMLIADKIQNFKDFQLYHDGRHIRSYELNKYFNDWLYALGISQNLYQEFKIKLLTSLNK